MPTDVNLFLNLTVPSTFGDVLEFVDAAKRAGVDQSGVLEVVHGEADGQDYREFSGLRLIGNAASLGDSKTVEVPRDTLLSISVLLRDLISAEGDGRALLGHSEVLRKELLDTLYGE